MNALKSFLFYDGERNPEDQKHFKALFGLRGRIKKITYLICTRISRYIRTVDGTHIRKVPCRLSIIDRVGCRLYREMYAVEGEYKKESYKYLVGFDNDGNCIADDFVSITWKK